MESASHHPPITERQPSSAENGELGLSKRIRIHASGKFPAKLNIIKTNQLNGLGVTGDRASTGSAVALT